jgi:anti-anti-sigma factor
MSSQVFEARLRQPVMPLRHGIIIDMFGEINGAVEHALNSAYHNAEAENPEIIILNFSHVQYINSTGIALIVGLLAKARREKRTLAVYGLSDHYAELFFITRLADFMTMFPDEQSAISEIASTTTQKTE